MSVSGETGIGSLWGIETVPVSGETGIGSLWGDRDSVCVR